MRDIHNDLKITQLTDPVTATTTTTSSSIDMQGYDSAELVVNVGESGDTLSGTVKWDLSLEESADDSTFTKVATADALVKGNTITTLTTGIFATIDAAAEDDAVYKVGYVGGKRYVRVVATATGTHTNGTPLSISGIRGNAALKTVN